MSFLFCLFVLSDVTVCLDRIIPFFLGVTWNNVLLSLHGFCFSISSIYVRCVHFIVLISSYAYLVPIMVKTWVEIVWVTFTPILTTCFLPLVLNLKMILTWSWMRSLSWSVALWSIIPCLNPFLKVCLVSFSHVMDDFC